MARSPMAGYDEGGSIWEQVRPIRGPLSCSVRTAAFSRMRSLLSQTRLQKTENGKFSTFRLSFFGEVIKIAGSTRFNLRVCLLSVDFSSNSGDAAERGFLIQEELHPSTRGSLKITSHHIASPAAATSFSPRFDRFRLDNELG